MSKRPFLLSRVLLLTIMMLSLAVVSPLATTAQGNSEAAHACQKGGYLNYDRGDGLPFANTGQCVSHVANGGSLVLLPAARCKQEAWDAGYDPSGFTIIAGTDGNDDFSGRVTAGADLICGFGGDDSLQYLSAGDIFLGGAGDDGVKFMNGGVFYGGSGSDLVEQLSGGTFYGGPDRDDVAYHLGGTFYQD